MFREEGGRLFQRVSSSTESFGPQVGLNHEKLHP